MTGRPEGDAIRIVIVEGPETWVELRTKMRCLVPNEGALVEKVPRYVEPLNTATDPQPLQTETTRSMRRK